MAGVNVEEEATCSQPFFEEDTPHGKAKRMLLRSILGTYFGIHIRQGFPSMENLSQLGRSGELIASAGGGEDLPFRCNIFDPYCGKGHYGKGKLDDLTWKDVHGEATDFGSPIVAISCALNQVDRVLAQEKKSKKSYEYLKNDAIHLVRFVFADADLDCLHELIPLVEKFFHMRRWKTMSKWEGDKIETHNFGREAEGWQLRMQVREKEITFFRSGTHPSLPRSSSSGESSTTSWTVEGEFPRGPCSASWILSTPR